MNMIYKNELLFIYLFIYSRYLQYLEYKLLI